MNLLLVDDERIAVRGMMQGVDWKGCGVDGEVLTAYNAAQALSVLEETPVSLILCDIEMPGESGIDLIRQVRARWPKTACIFLTCHADFTYAQEALRLGCLDYILKPAPYESIEAAVKKAVSGLKQAEEQETLLRYGSDWLSRQQESAARSQPRRRTPGELAAAVRGYVMENLSSPELTVQSAANHFYLNEDYLGRLFKKAEGVSLSKFIIRERMELAARLLQNESISASAAAQQAGYPNYSYFAEAFKKYFGCTPTEYRQK